MLLWANCVRHRRAVTKTLLMMKFTAILLLMASLTVAANGFAQKLSLSEKNASLETVFKSIQKQTGYSFLFTVEQVRKAGRVNLKLENVDLETALKQLFRGQPLSYQIIDKTVVVKPASLLSPPEVPEPEPEPLFISVRGRVLNENGEPVSGATVQVKGKSGKGTFTNEKGEFLLDDIGEDDVLLISGVSIEPIEIRVGSRTEITVSAKIKVQETESVVVSTGYEKIPKERLTGSVVVVDKETIQRSVSSNLIERLEGITPGLLIDRNSRSNPVRLQIRGLYTLGEENAVPLIILNNFPYEGNIEDINPNDVENITILRDAAATSIWGARAGNGVIIITTQTGQYKQRPQLQLSSNFTFQEKTDLFATPRLTPSEIIDFEKYLFGLGIYDANILDGRVPLSGVVDVLAKQRSGQLSASEAEAMINEFRTRDARRDFEKYIYRPAAQQQYNISLSGGSEDLRYRIAAGYDKNLTALRGNETDRVSINSNLTVRVSPKLEITTGLNYAINTTLNNSPGEFGNLAYSMNRAPMPLYSRLADEFGNPLPLDVKHSSIYTDTAGGGRLLDWKYRPLDELKYLDRQTKIHSLTGNLSLRYKPFKFLSAEVNYQVTRNESVFENKQRVEIYEMRDLINDFTILTPTSIIYNVPNAGRLIHVSEKVNSHGLRGQLSFDHSWHNKHQLVALVAGELRERKVNQISNMLYGYDDRLGTKIVDYNTVFPLYSGFSNRIPAQINPLQAETDRFVSILGNLSYTYKQRYTFYSSIRKDASNLFGVDANNRGRPFWSGGTRWNLSREKFFRSKILRDLSLQASYGYSGNVDNNLSARTTITYWTANSNTFNNIPAAVISSFPNPTLRWEKVRTFNLGLHFGMSNGILSGSLEYYHKRSIDVYAGAPQDPTVGFSQLRTNSANITGQGFDFLLNSSVPIGKDLRWNSTFAISRSFYKLTRYLLPNNRTSHISSGTTVLPLIGEHPYLVTSFRWAGLDPLTGNPRGFLGKDTSMDYTRIVRETPLEDYIKHGPAMPKVFGNWLHNFNWKGFGLSTNIEYKFGHYFRKSSLDYGNFFTNANAHPEIRDRWQQPGDEKFTNVPSMIFPVPNANRDGFYRSAEINVFPADIIRLNDLRLTYSNTGGRKKNNAPHLQFFANITGLNLMIWRANKAGLDPENPDGHARLRSLSIGINSRF